MSGQLVFSLNFNIEVDCIGTFIYCLDGVNVKGRYFSQELK